MTAAVVKGRLIPTDSSAPPNTPCRPKAISIANPTTTGGSTMGNSTSTSTALTVRELLRARKRAKGVPKPTITNILTPLVRSDSRNA